MNLTQCKMMPLRFGSDQGRIVFYCKIDIGDLNPAETVKKFLSFYPRTVKPVLYFDVARSVQLKDLEALYLETRAAKIEAPLIIRAWFRKPEPWHQRTKLVGFIQRVEYDAWTGTDFPEIHVSLSQPPPEDTIVMGHSNYFIEAAGNLKMEQLVKFVFQSTNLWKVLIPAAEISQDFLRKEKV